AAPEDLDHEGTPAHRLFRGETPLLTYLKAHQAAHVQLFAASFDQINDRVASDHVEAVGCICLMDDCRKSWPIVPFDAAPIGDVPYACGVAYPTPGDHDFMMGYYFGPLWR